MLNLIEVWSDTVDDYHQIQIFIKKSLERRGIEFEFEGYIKYTKNEWRMWDDVDEKLVKYIDAFLMEASKKYPGAVIDFRFTDTDIAYDSDAYEKYGYDDEETHGHFFRNGNKQVSWFC